MAALDKRALEVTCPWNGRTIAVPVHELHRRQGFPWIRLERILYCSGCASEVPCESHPAVTLARY